MKLKHLAFFFTIFLSYKAISQPTGIKTVLFYAYGQGDDFAKRINNPPVVFLNQKQTLILEFDNLNGSFNQYKAKIKHLNIEGKISDLSEIEFIDGFNEYFVNDYSVSENTKVPFYHYGLKIPTPKISGNFILQLFENNDIEPVIELPFWVVENKISISSNVIVPRDTEFWKTHQQIDVNFDIGDAGIVFAQRDLKVFLRQNQRIEKTIELPNSGMKISGINAFTFRFFNNENLFEAGNEFRFLDISSNMRRGQNIASIRISNPDEYYTITQKKRSGKAFLDSYDNNGGYLINSIDNGSDNLKADYANVIFSLDEPYDVENTKPVLLGKLTDWQPLEMNFNPNTQLFEIELMLKQGIYDFIFGLKDLKSGIISERIIEGSFSDTRNTYEILIYESIPGKRTYRLLGYQKIIQNQ
ncbi:MAG: DUF5103 domain-containing protein [Spirosomataceae bacterium]